tara:strand:- start:65 stop:241 length:177 start_codon:yes stop_codon:yes gene_type:complete
VVFNWLLFVLHGERSPVNIRQFKEKQELKFTRAVEIATASSDLKVVHLLVNQVDVCFK